VTWQWLTPTIVLVRKHWPWLLSSIVTGLLALLYNVYVLGGITTEVRINLGRIASLATGMEDMKSHLLPLEAHYDDLGARIEILERQGSPFVQSLVTRIVSLEAVSKDLHELLGRIESLQEHARGDAERFDALNRRIGGVEDRGAAADTAISNRMDRLEDRLNGRRGR
jgi:hypothetical protein